MEVFNINVNKNKDSHSTTAAAMVHETGWRCRCWWLDRVRTENSIESIRFFRSSLKTGQAEKPALAGQGQFLGLTVFFAHRDVYKHRPRPVQFNHCP